MGSLQSLKCQMGMHKWNNPFWKNQDGKCVEVHVCSQCSKEIMLQSTLHDWSEWAFTPGQCEQNRKCAKCGKNETRRVNHEWGGWLPSDDHIHENRRCRRCSVTETRLSPLQQTIVDQISVLKAGIPIYDAVDDPKNIARKNLTEIGEPVVFPLLAAAKECTGFPLKLIIECLALIGDRRAFDLFVGALKSNDKDIRRVAAVGLGRLRTAEGSRILIELRPSRIMSLTFVLLPRED